MKRLSKRQYKVIIIFARHCDEFKINNLEDILIEAKRLSKIPVPDSPERKKKSALPIRKKGKSKKYKIPNKNNKYREKNGRIDYEKYIKSADWKKKRLNYILKYGAMCEICKRKPGINLHHQSYKSLGREMNRDLLYLCKYCHHAIHYGADDVFTTNEGSMNKNLRWLETEVMKNYRKKMESRGAVTHQSARTSAILHIHRPTDG